jgi:CRP-like cAMP-binding protein
VLRYLTSAGKAVPAGSQAEILQALGQVAFLSGVAREDLASLADGARMERRRQGDEVYRAGSAGEHFYVMRSGSVALEAAEGARVVVKAPAFFGEEALTGEPRMDTVRVLEDAELVVVGGIALRATVLHNPFLALELAKALSDRPSARERRG